jgi:hypothetical protein
VSFFAISEGKVVIYGFRTATIPWASAAAKMRGGGICGDLPGAKARQQIGDEIGRLKVWGGDEID